MRRSKSTEGRIRSNHVGSHQFHRSNTAIRAGTSTIRTMVASTAIANQRCLEPGFGGGQEMLAAIEAEIDAALPEGGAFVREFERVRSRCR